jgi:type IV pilus assembly protein PilB
MGVEPFLVASSVNLVLAQRLARVVCPTCKEEEPMAAEALTRLGWSNEPFMPVRGAGCPSCGGTGYRGRIALYEVMPITDHVREMIVTGATAIELKRAAIQSGMVTLRQAGLIHAARGTTSIEEVLRVSISD